MISLNKPGTERYPKFKNNDLKTYINNVYDMVLPIDIQSLLLTVIEFTKAVDYYSMFIDFTDNDRLLSLLSISWCWHQDIRQRYNRLDDELFTYCYILSWVNLSRLLNLRLHEYDKIDILTHKSSNEFTFIQKISNNEKIIISNQHIKSYSLKLLWQSIVLLWPCLYKYPYSDDMRIYFNSLYSHFCECLTYIRIDNSFPKYCRKLTKEDIEEDTEDYSLIDYYSNKFEYNTVSLHIDNNNDTIFKSCFFFDTELILYHQLSRISVVKKLFSLYNKNKFIYVYNDNGILIDRIAKMVLCFKESIIGFIENEFLKNDIWEALKLNLARLYLMHGENERFLRDNYMKSNQVHSDEVFNKIRQNDYQKINSLKEKIPKDFINEYTDNFTSFIESNKTINGDYSLLFDSYNLSDFKSEKESIFLTFLCFEKWVALSGIKINLKDIFYYDIITDNINKIDDIFDIFDQVLHTKMSRIPIFITVMKHSFVLDIKNKKIFHSLFFIEAFTIWIILLIKENIINNKNNNDNAGLSKFKNFEKFIKFIYKI